jgi:peptidoglycan/xylan/chitin deacetylase (PgdA/CDA1 family)
MNRQKVLILTYHRFSAEEAEEKTSASMFAKQLQYLKANYQVLPLSLVVDYLNGNSSLPPYSAAITIDDGYADAYHVAYPLLRKFGLPATLYVVPGFVDGECWIWTDKARYICLNTHHQSATLQVAGTSLEIQLGNKSSRLKAALRINERLKRLSNESKGLCLEEISRSLDVVLPEVPPKELQSVSWEQAREMDCDGMEIGSHTMTHPILTNVTQEHLHQELSRSRKRLEEVLERKVTNFCYPNGDNDRRVHEEVARAGYKIAVTTISGLNQRGDDPLTLRRIHTECDLPHFVQSTSGFENLKSDIRSRIRKSN